MLSGRDWQHRLLKTRIFSSPQFKHNGNITQFLPGKVFYNATNGCHPLGKCWLVNDDVRQRWSFRTRISNWWRHVLDENLLCVIPADVCIADEEKRRYADRANHCQQLSFA